MPAQNRLNTVLSSGTGKMPVLKPVIVFEAYDSFFCKSVLDWRDQTSLSKSTTESPEPVPAIITEYHLYPNYPNPFNPHTTIGYQLPEAGMVRLKIYNLEGKLVRTLVESSQTAAYHQVPWDATDDAGNAVAAGIYLCQMQAGAFRQTQRLVLLK